jgi:hypothetical protein
MMEVESSSLDDLSRICSKLGVERALMQMIRRGGGWVWVTRFSGWFEVCYIWRGKWVVRGWGSDEAWNEVGIQSILIGTRNRLSHVVWDCSKTTCSKNFVGFSGGIDPSLAFFPSHLYFPSILSIPSISITLANPRVANPPAVNHHVNSTWHW